MKIEWTEDKKNKILQLVEEARQREGLQDHPPGYSSDNVFTTITGYLTQIEKNEKSEGKFFALGQKSDNSNSVSLSLFAIPYNLEAL